MKRLVVLTAAAAAAAVLAAPSHAHYPAVCTASMKAERQLRCATHNKNHAQAAITWAKKQRRAPAVANPARSRLLAAIVRNHRWLYRESVRDQAEARARMWLVLPETRDWLTAVAVVQRVFPGSAWWQIACSSSEGGHGAWVYYGRLPYPKYGPWRTPGGPMQYMQGTFWGDFRAALTKARERRFVVPRSAHSWFSMLGQALASGYAYHYNRPPGKWTGWRC